jgi:hypothetical protein
VLVVRGGGRGPHASPALLRDRQSLEDDDR